MYLSELKVGEFATIKALNVEESIRRRLLDIGMIPGTKVECVMNSPFKGNSAYFIRGSLIAIRDLDAKKVIVECDLPNER